MEELKKLQQKRLKVNFVDDDDDESSVATQKTINTYTMDITDVRNLNVITSVFS